jgi:hypothetical protein
VVIPRSVTNLGDFVFASCIFMTNATIYGGFGSNTFQGCGLLTNVTIGTNVTRIGEGMFRYCARLPSINIPDSVTNIGNNAFENCSKLATMTIPDSVIIIGNSAFLSCSNLTDITLGSNVTSIGSHAFDTCSSLRGAYFRGNAPSADSTVFSGDNNATVYYLPGTLGWGPTFGGRPTAPWPLPYPVILKQTVGLGLPTNGFGFSIAWNTNIPVVIEACTDVANPLWSPVGTNTLTNGLSYFSDAQWTNSPSSFYRVRSP